jgi:hypothetical protein
MNMVGHQHVPNDHEAITLSRLFNDPQEQVAASGSTKPWLPVITTAGKKVQMIVPVVSPEARRHVFTLRRRLSLQQKRQLQNRIRFRNGKAHPLQKTQRMGHPDFVPASKGAPPATCQPTLISHQPQRVRHPPAALSSQPRSW